jgi:hypothetical protein
MRHARLLLVLLFFAGPLAWSLQLAVALSAWPGMRETGRRGAVLAAPLAGAALCLLAALAAGALRRRLPERGEPVDSVPPLPWLALGAVVISLLFALVCFGSAASALILPPVEPPQ